MPVESSAHARRNLMIRHVQSGNWRWAPLCGFFLLRTGRRSHDLSYHVNDTATKQEELRMPFTITRKASSCGVPDCRAQTPRTPVAIRRLGYAAIAFVSVIAAPLRPRSTSVQGEPPRLEGPVRTLRGEELEAHVGTITDVGMDARSNIYVLDGARGAVDVFAREGSFIAEAVIDSQGAVAAKAMAVTATGRALVLPADGHQLIEFQLEETKVRRLNSIRISVAGGDVCAGRRSVFVLGSDSGRGGLVSQYAFDGDPGPQFGVALAGNAPPSAMTDFQGRIACGDGVVAVGSGFSPTVELYEDGGRLVWRSAVRPYRSLHIERLPNDGYSLSIPPGGVDVVSGILLFRHTVVVQLQRSGNVTAKVLTLFFGGGPNERLSVQNSSWPLIRRIYGAWALATTGRPHPVIAVYLARSTAQ
jgi:hypothetical protein